MKIKWPFVSRARWESVNWFRVQYSSLYEHYRNEYFRQRDRHLAEISARQKAEMEKALAHAGYHAFRAHVKKYAPDALKKRNDKGQFTGERW